MTTHLDYWIVNYGASEYDLLFTIFNASKQATKNKRIMKHGTVSSNNNRQNKIHYQAVYNEIL